MKEEVPSVRSLFLSSELYTAHARLTRLIHSRRELSSIFLAMNTELLRCPSRCTMRLYLYRRRANKPTNLAPFCPLRTIDDILHALIQASNISLSFMASLFCLKTLKYACKHKRLRRNHRHFENPIVRELLR